MNTLRLRSNLLLLLTAVIWGMAFVAQRVGMEHIGPMLFNGIRFVLGALSLVPLLIFFSKHEGRREKSTLGTVLRRKFSSSTLLLGFGAGTVLFAGASLQQVGLVTTTAGNAGFITGIYVILVPIMGIAWGQKTGLLSWIGAFMALAGMYLLSIKEGFSMAPGDLLVLLGSFFWALHVHIIGHAASRHDALVLSFIQYLFCAAFSLVWAVAAEDWTGAGVVAAMPAILYGGIMSVGVAYTLQVVAQKNAKPSHAAIILSLEGAFAALGGWLLIGELFSVREFAGAMVMLTGMIVSQFDNVS